MVVINGVPKAFDACGVIDSWFGFLILKRKYIYVYVIDTPRFNEQVRLETDLPTKIKYYKRLDLIDNFPAFMYADLYRLKKSFTIVKIINNTNTNIIPAVRLGLKLKKGSNNLKKYCRSFCCLYYPTSIVPISFDYDPDYCEFLLYSCEDTTPVVHDFACDDLKIMYIGLLFHSAITKQRNYYLFDITKGYQYIDANCRRFSK